MQIRRWADWKSLTVTSGTLTCSLVEWPRSRSLAEWWDPHSPASSPSSSSTSAKVIFRTIYPIHCRFRYLNFPIVWLRWSFLVRKWRPAQLVHGQPAARDPEGDAVADPVRQLGRRGDPPALDYAATWRETESASGLSGRNHSADGFAGLAGDGNAVPDAERSHSVQDTCQDHTWGQVHAGWIRPQTLSGHATAGSGRRLGHWIAASHHRIVRPDRAEQNAQTQIGGPIKPICRSTH